MTILPKSAIPALVIWALGLTQIIGYGTLYYSFSALAPSMARDFGWSEEWVYGVLSGSLLVGGLVAPISGSWADKFGAAKVMIWGSVAAAAALALCALAPERITFVLGLVAIEVASAFVLYSTAFAALAQVSGQGAQRSITHLTLIAGFASTIFWPLTATLHDVMSWREIYLIFAGMNLAVCLPVHVWLASHTRRQQAAPTPVMAPEAAPMVPPGDEGKAQLLMLLGFAMLSLVSSAILVHMIPTLAALGLGASGVFVTTLFGPAQVLSRLVNMQFGKGLSQPALAVFAAVLQPLALIVLVISAPSPIGAGAFAVMFGLGNGLLSIVSGTLPLVLFGRSGYGKRLGVISSARLIVSSFAPVVFALLVEAISTTIALWAIIPIGLISSAAFLAMWVRHSAGKGSAVAEPSIGRT